MKNSIPPLPTLTGETLEDVARSDFDLESAQNNLHYTLLFRDVITITLLQIVSASFALPPLNVQGQ